MEGRWGRRVFGSVRNVVQTRPEGTERVTVFTLWFRASKELLRVREVAITADLEEFPDLYGIILDQMVEKIERAINTPP